jgi:alkanesulfonate monooxygenase SsuD/methylene tetrahydromethanopterin reductase-like flavin-dependent oxidoreductase (luciferase family)
VQDTDEKAREAGKGFLAGNVGVGGVPLPRDYMAPVGYNIGSKAPRYQAPKYQRLREKVRADPFSSVKLEPGAYEAAIDANRWIIGSPDTVVSKLRDVLALLRPGIVGIWTNDGSMSHEDTMRCLELMGQEVLPALREIGEELELTDPFQKTP